MAYYRDMGMRIETGGKGEDAGVARLYAEPYLSGRSSYQRYELPEEVPEMVAEPEAERREE